MPRRPKAPPASAAPQALPAQLQHLNLNAAGIDIGSTAQFVAVPPDRDPQPVRQFATFTADLHRLADWLTACGVDTVVLESTAVYWIPLFEILEARGFTHRVPGPARECPARQARAWAQVGCARLSMAATAPHLRSAPRCVSPCR